MDESVVLLHWSKVRLRSGFCSVSLNRKIFGYDFPAVCIKNGWPKGPCMQAYGNAVIRATDVSNASLNGGHGQVKTGGQIGRESVGSLLGSVTYITEWESFIV